MGVTITCGWTNYKRAERTRWKAVRQIHVPDLVHSSCVSPLQEQKPWKMIELNNAMVLYLSIYLHSDLIRIGNTINCNLHFCLTIKFGLTIKLYAYITSY